MSMLNNSTTVYNGTATITMRLEPVPDVPISIKTMYNNTLTIWNQESNNHFGNTPISGTVAKLVKVEK